MVYIPVREDVDMTVNHCSYTLGQLQIRNGQAQAYVERLQQQLPGSIQITVYDQGYTAVSQSLEDMLRMVQIIAGVCLAVGLGFLVLFGYLLVYRQRGVGRTMIRVGAAGGTCIPISCSAPERWPCLRRCWDGSSAGAWVWAF